MVAEKMGVSLRDVEMMETRLSGGDFSLNSLQQGEEGREWIETIEDDGLEFIKKMENHDDKILFLSWIDYTKNELPYNLLTNFKGNMVISVGNYREIDCKKYMDELSKNYKLIAEYHCKMPWDDVEEIKIFIN